MLRFYKLKVVERRAATKQGKEPLKQGQDKPTPKQKEKQEKAQDKSLKADKPKKSRGMKM